MIDRRREFFDFAVAGDAAEQPRAFRGQAFVLDLARGSDKDAARAVARRHERSQQLAVDFIYRLDRAEDRQRQRMAFPEFLGEQVVDEIVGRVLGLRNFLQHDLALALYLGRIEHRFEKNIREHLGRHLEVLAEHLGVVAGVLLAGEGVEHAADGVEGLGDLRGGALFGALEQQVLDEMRGAVFGRLLVARAVLDPNANRRGDHLRHRLGENAHAVSDNALLNHSPTNFLFPVPAQPHASRAESCRCDRRRELSR